MIRMVSFTDITDTESAMILKWRNHPDVRSFMYTNIPITQEEHQRFLLSLADQTDKLYFLVYEDDTPLGVIDFCSIDDESATIGIYADPYRSAKGTGSMLMCALIDYAFLSLHLKKLTAECFIDNDRAKYLYEKFDFKETKRILHNGREVILMECNYANRQP